MNPEILVGATTVGYIAGQLAEQHALSVIAHNRVGAVEAQVGASERSLRFGGPLRLVSGLALIGALTGFTAAKGLEAQSNPGNGSMPVVNEVIDHDFTSGIDGVSNVENAIAINYFDAHLADTHLITAHNGTTDPVTSTELKKDQPYGPSSIEQSVSNTLSVGFEHAPSAQTNLLKSTNAVSGAEVLFIDDRDVINNPSNIETDANEAGHVPVYILDVKGKGTPPATTANLQNIALATGGQYWAVSSANAGNVANQMKAAIKPREKQPNKPEGDNLDWLVVSAILAATGVRLYLRRKSETATS